MRQLTDGSGAPVMAQNYAPYGDVLESYGAESSNYGFAGEWTDGTGLQYLRARYLNTGIGRFFQKDPFAGMEELPQTINPYLYVLNNPVLYTDPSGEVIPLILSMPLAGAILGGVLGGTFAALTYKEAIQGKCGCEFQEKAKCMSPGQWRGTFAAYGALAGAVFGLIGAFAPATTIIVGRIGLTLAAVDALKASYIMVAETGITWCGVTRLLFDVVGMALSAYAIRAGQSAQAASGSKWTWPAKQIPVSEGLSKIAQIRQMIYGIGNKRTVAYSENSVPGVPNELIAVSGEANPRPGTVVGPRPGILRAKSGFEYHAEVHILEYIASIIPKGTSGRIRLFIERPSCTYSCVGVIENFMNMFPNIELIISTGPKKP